MSRLALGTAQFGLDYGINNVRGKVPKDEAFNILDIALNGGIDTIDTAVSYGNSQEVIGEYLKERGKKFKVISKLSADSKEEVRRVVHDSLKALGLDNIYGYLLHDFSQYLRFPKIWGALEELKSKGKIKKMGFSLYHPRDLDRLLNADIKFDLIQVPYSVFDQRFAPYFGRLKKNNVEIHARSVYLQGLVFKRPDQLSGDFLGIKSKLRSLAELSAEAGVSIASLCLNFAVLDKNIDKIVAGVDSAANISEILGALNETDRVKGIYHKLSFLREDDEKIILPFNWKKEKAGVGR
jgi:aryl-alcohol dehydrogenase-like predicted oxidoreductase